MFTCEEARNIMVADRLGPEVFDLEWVEDGARTKNGGIDISCHSGCDEMYRRSALQKGMLACGEVQAISVTVDRLPIRNKVPNGRTASAIARCYLKALHTNWKLKGEIQFSWSVNSDGRVIDARVIRYSGGLKKVAACAVEAVKGMGFDDVVGPAKVVELWSLRPSTE